MVTDIHIFTATSFMPFPPSSGLMVNFLLSFKKRIPSQLDNRLYSSFSSSGSIAITCRRNYIKSFLSICLIINQSNESSWQPIPRMCGKILDYRKTNSKTDLLKTSTFWDRFCEKTSTNSKLGQLLSLPSSPWLLSIAISFFAYYYYISPEKKKFFLFSIQERQTQYTHIVL